MNFIKQKISATLLVCVFATTLFGGAGMVCAATTADWVGAGVGTVLGIANQAAKQEKAKEEQKANQQKLNEQARSEARDHIFATIKNMKEYIKDNAEKEMWKDLGDVLQEKYKAFPKTEHTATKTVMTLTDRENGVDITEIIVYDKATNTITVSVEHNPGFKEEMSDKAK